jgi:cytidylate kinase
MRAWTWKLQNQQHFANKPAAAPLRELVQPFLALSRECGTNASELARRVADELQWKALDGELLEYLVERYQWSRVSLDFVDEKTASWFHEMFGKWLDRQLVSQAEYVQGLGRIALLASQHESTVFVGRGVQFILPRNSGTAVRIIAPLKQRVKCIMERRHCDRHTAERFIEQTDRGRRDFVQRYFHHDNADPHLYDLVINMAHVSMDDAVSLVVRRCKRRFPGAVASIGEG